MSGISDPNTILMTAVLSMDVYDRDQDLSSPEIRGMLDSDLGDATLIEAPTYDVNTLFGAAAWNFNGNVIITYRGTVSSSFGNFYTEALNGYGVGAGKPFGPQATQAIHFYQQIADLSDTSYSYSGNYHFNIVAIAIRLWLDRLTFTRSWRSLLFWRWFCCVFLLNASPQDLKGFIHWSVSY